MKKAFLSLLVLSLAPGSHAQPATELLQKIRARLDQVNDYQATGTMKTNVSFLKEPEASVTVYFKKPDKLKIRNDKGISFVPKGAVTISLNNLLKGAFNTQLQPLRSLNTATKKRRAAKRQSAAQSDLTKSSTTTPG